MSKEKINISLEVSIALVKAGVKTQILQNDIVQQLNTLERGDKVIITKLFIETIAQYVKVNKLTNFSFDNLNAVMEKQGISMALSQAFYICKLLSIKQQIKKLKHQTIFRLVKVY
ncbi:MAG: hypothetical protein WCP46_09640 [Alphaproteobacteria bacterium]